MVDGTRCRGGRASGWGGVFCSRGHFTKKVVIIVRLVMGIN